MTTEEKKPIEVQITEGPHWKKILTEIFPHGHESEFTLKFNNFKAKMTVKILHIGTGDNKVIAGKFVNLDESITAYLRAALKLTHERCHIYFNGEYDKDKANGSMHLFVLGQEKDTYSNLNMNLPKMHRLSEENIEAVLKLQNQLSDNKKAKPTRVTDDQMDELKKIIMNSPDGDDFGRKAVCWLLDKSENLTKRVALTFSKEFGEQGESASGTAHAFVSANCATRIDLSLEKIGTNFRLIHHGASFNDKNEWDAVYRKGGTIWFSNVWYDQKPEQIFHANAEIIKEIGNYNSDPDFNIMDETAREIQHCEKVDAANEIIFQLKQQIVKSIELRESEFGLKALLRLIDMSEKFTKPAGLEFPGGRFLTLTTADSIEAVQRKNHFIKNQINTDMEFCVSWVRKQGVKKYDSLLICLKPRELDAEKAEITDVDDQVKNTIDSIDLSRFKMHDSETTAKKFDEQMRTIREKIINCGKIDDFCKKACLYLLDKSKCLTSNQSIEFLPTLRSFGRSVDALMDVNNDKINDFLKNKIKSEMRFIVMKSGHGDGQGNHLEYTTLHLVPAAIPHVVDKSIVNLTILNEIQGIPLE
ncbi:MAG: hypothetical protein V1928_05185 [Parcubacteria group bacterium]